MHPDPAIILVAELRSQELIAEAQREKLAWQAIATASDARNRAGSSRAQLVAFSLAVVLVITFVILVANASSDIAIQAVATGP